MSKLRVAATSDNNETYMYYSAELKAWVEDCYFEPRIEEIIEKMKELER